MFTITYKGIPVACETAQDAVEFCDAADQPTKHTSVLETVGDLEDRVKERKPRKQTRTTPSRTEKDKRNAKARAAYLEKHPKGRADDSMTHREATTTTSRLEALPSKPTHIGRGRGSRAKTSSAVIATLKRSPSPLTLDEIDMDLEKSGWPYTGRDRKGAIRATLSRLKINGTVSTFKRGTGMEAMQMFRLERTNGDTPTPVEQVLNGPTREERAEVEDSKEQMLADEARADAEGDPDAREF